MQQHPRVQTPSLNDKEPDLGRLDHLRQLCYDPNKKRDSDLSGVIILGIVESNPNISQTVDDLAVLPQTQLTFPDGGWVAWLNVLGSVLICFMTVGATQSFGVFQDFYTRSFLTERTPSEISWIGSTQIFLMFLLSPISGKLFDEGYFRILLFASSLLYLLCIFMLSIAQSHHFYEIFLSQGIGLGLASGFMFLPSISIITHYFSVRRSFIMGVVVAGSSVAGILIPIMLNHLFNDSRVGFAWSVRYLGFIFLGLLLIANLTMKPRFRGRKSFSRKESLQLLKKLFTDVPYLLTVSGLTVIYLGLYFPLFYLQLFAVLHGIDMRFAFYSITILNASSFVGRIIPNFLADSYGPLNIVAPIGICCGLTIFLMFAAKSIGALIIFAVLYGFLSGTILGLAMVTVSTFADDISEVGFRCGVAMFFQSFTLLTGTPVMGALLAAPRYTWHRPIIFSGVTVLVGSVSLLISRMQLAKRRGKWRV